MTDRRGRPVAEPPHDLEASLRRLAQQLDVPAEPDYSAIVARQLTGLVVAGPVRPRPRRPAWITRLHPLAATVVAVVALVAVVLGVPSAREAVAELFGFESVRVRQLPPDAPTPRSTLDPALDLGRRVSLADARRLQSFPVRVPVLPGAGTPEVYLRRDRGLVSVSLVYPPSAAFPAGGDPAVGLLLSEYAGTGTPYFDKLVGETSSVDQVAVDGRWPGLYFPEPQHVFVLDERGVVHLERARLSGPSLVWVRGGVTYRLEASLEQATLLSLAASLG